MVPFILKGGEKKTKGKMGSVRESGGFRPRHEKGSVAFPLGRLSEENPELASDRRTAA